MNLADSFILVILIATALAGVRYGIIKQIVVSAGMMISLFAVALLYNKLAFLTARSGTRSLILGLMMLAVIFLCYDICLKLGDWLRGSLLKHRKHRLVRTERLGGAVVAIFSAITIVWLVASLFGNTSGLFFSRQLGSSKLVAGVNRLVETPTVFRRLAHLLEPFSPPEAFAEAEPAFDQTDTAISREFASLDAAITRTKPAVVKINSWGCGSTTTGSGFLAGKNIIVTNAHVVAGVDRMSVQDPAGSYAAQAIWFDPKLDMAILMTETELGGTPLRLQLKTLEPGSIGEVLGFPGGLPATGDATVLKLLSASGYDIYGKAKSIRKIYVIRGAVVPGNSGGPLINSDGEVVGMVFGHSAAQDKTGYAITADQIDRGLKVAQQRNEIVKTGSCTGHK